MRLAEEAVCEEICLCKEICLRAKRSVINLEGNGLDAEAAKALGPAISASMSLTSVNLSLILELRQFNVQHRHSSRPRYHTGSPGHVFRPVNHHFCDIAVF